ncbi:hypothetical protein BKA56DRAFT_701818 [Ilyonectria sp. MPI-CAGE-AT-0026]|nr:hypothetical protein BKA56DRAFT_701818 [Ilyonectria sp. MPI-CAGE-AT-0026]
MLIWARVLVVWARNSISATGELMGVQVGGYELLKTRTIDALGHESASKNRYAVSLGSSVVVEIASGIAICPLEAVRTRVVPKPGFERGLLDGFARFVREEGI